MKKSKVVGTGKRAPGYVYVSARKVDGEDRILAVVEVRGGAYSRIKAITDALSPWDSAPPAPADVFASFLEERCGDLARGCDEGTRAVVAAVCDGDFDNIEVKAIERATLEALD